jgi:hypothetical protein
MHNVECEKHHVKNCSDCWHEIPEARVMSKEIANGDKVTYRRCFGESELTFVGMAEELKFNNNCVLIKDGDAVPACFCDVEKLKEH